VVKPVPIELDDEEMGKAAGSSALRCRGVSARCRVVRGVVVTLCVNCNACSVATGEVKNAK
jgi:hypothetical protein